MRRPKKTEITTLTKSLKLIASVSFRESEKERAWLSVGADHSKYWNYLLELGATDMRTDHVRSYTLLKRKKVGFLNVHKLHWICRKKKKKKVTFILSLLYLKQDRDIKCNACTCEHDPEKYLQQNAYETNP